MLVNNPLEAVLDKVNRLLYKTNEMAETLPGFGNTLICIDSISTASRAGINFYYSPSPVAKAFFFLVLYVGLLVPRLSHSRMYWVLRRSKL
jgi:hypothetical protein